MNQLTALITGATSGIGKATAELFAQKGLRLVLCGRRKEELDDLMRRLSAQTDVYTLAFDVRQKETVFQQIASLPDSFRKIDILINNAGNAHGLEPIHEGNLDDWDAMIDGNVKGLLYVTKAIVGQMVERQSGHIVHIGSLAAKAGYPKGAVYCASKAAVDMLNEAMRMDLYEHNIRVSAIHPGLVETNFSEVRFKGDKQRAKKVYEGITPLTAEDIAEIIYFMVSRPAHVNIADLVVLPTAQASALLVKRKT
ncbi:MAG: SDR family NAD(P)-dependent oxidoreductase [Flammeovirgaceae bacterium]|nr:SDR family NAD(P)-dependent oxidoreductase [Flammeovirgaceae bacterium]MDW8286746.1 SDR family NAD(P)-dependent oxidoreductase [Flammeovirgaceae bacterium]